VSYRVKLLRGEGKASFLMEHGRFGPPGLLGGKPGAPNAIHLRQGNKNTVPEHLSKGEGYLLRAGDYLAVDTPGGGGYGDPGERAPELLDRDRRAGYFPT
jgi:N-methylhydantoinase B